MFNFKALDIEDSRLFHRYLGTYPFNTYDYSFTSLYQWRKFCNTQICIVDDVLIVKKHTDNTGSFFMQPISTHPENIDQVIKKMYDYKQGKPEFKFMFGEVDTDFLAWLQNRYGDKVVYKEDVNNYDYIYSSSDLMSLSGNKYHRKKNQYNKFVNSYDYQVRDIRHEQVRQDCIELAYHWCQTTSQTEKILNYELEGIKDILNNITDFNVLGVAVYIGNQLAGFAFGEKLSETMAVVHCEKGDTNYSGIYAFINKALVEQHFSDVSLINRQEDMGLDGLRQAKMAYNPTQFAKKYFVDLLDL